MTNKENIYEGGLEEHPKRTIILGNLVMVSWLTLGTIACWFLSPLVAWIYLAVGIILVYFVLRRLVCVNCYYYDKWCGIGWGKLAALFFKPGDIDKFGTGVGVKLAPLAYGLLSLIPLVLVIIAMVQQFTVPRLVVLLLLLLASAYSGFMSRKKGCVTCKMRLICPGCTVKNEGSN
jgi:hypothetical protein